MPYGAMLINTARKEIVDEEGLIKMFETRPDFTYVSDIEPDCAQKIRERFDGRYLFTVKKMGAQTEEANMNSGLAAAKQIVLYFKNGDHTYQLNKF